MTTEQSAIAAALSSWKLVVGRAGKSFFSLTEEQLFAEVAPGKNRPIYVWGHLTAVHDALVTILGLGERLHPELDPIFVSSPDRAIDELPSGTRMKMYWEEVNSNVFDKLKQLPSEEWVKRHMAVSDEDFAKDPLRSRLSVLLSRTNHTSFHLGQVILIAK